MKQTEKNVLSLLASYLFKYDSNLSDINVSEIYEESIKQTIQLIISKELSEQGFVMNDCDIALFSNFAMNIKIRDAHRSLNNLLVSNGIPYVIIKGCASAGYYPEPQYRTMGDVDFLVHYDDVEKVKNILLEDGYSFKSADEDHHYVFKKNKNVFELHYDFNGIPNDNIRSIADKYLFDTIETSKTISVENGGTISVPDDFHHGLIILLHIAKHMSNEGLGLRHLCDWAVFVNSIDNFKEMFEEPLKSLGLWVFACQITAVCCKYLKLPNNDWCGKWDDALLDSIMDYVIFSGNFGRKSENNREGWLITNKYNCDSGKRSMFSQMIYTLNSVTYEHWPIAKKLVILIPFGWVYYGIRYIFRMIIGKRSKINVKKMIKNARSYNELFKEFQLFEI